MTNYAKWLTMTVLDIKHKIAMFDYEIEEVADSKGLVLENLRGTTKMFSKSLKLTFETMGVSGDYMPDISEEDRAAEYAALTFNDGTPEHIRIDQARWMVDLKKVLAIFEKHLAGVE